jgi:hypothetical protein
MGLAYAHTTTTTTTHVGGVNTRPRRHRRAIKVRRDGVRAIDAMRCAFIRVGGKIMECDQLILSRDRHCVGMMVVMGAWTCAVGGRHVRGNVRVCCDFATCALNVTVCD